MCFLPSTEHSYLACLRGSSILMPSIFGTHTVCVHATNGYKSCVLACRRLLRDEFRSGRLEAAPSKAAALEELCDRLKFEPDAASAIHKALFTERIESFLEDNQLTGVQVQKVVFGYFVRAYSESVPHCSFLSIWLQPCSLLHP